jgi:hypothetical protein
MCDAVPSLSTSDTVVVMFDLGFWFCESAHDAPCQLIYQAFFDESYPYRTVVIAVTFLFLSVTQILYYGCCVVICPFLIYQCYSNLPELWFILYNEEEQDDWATTAAAHGTSRADKQQQLTLSQTKQEMSTTGTFDYRIYSELLWKSSTECTTDRGQEEQQRGKLFVSTSSSSSSSSCDDSCPICLCSYQAEDETVRSIHCRHVYHENCLASWLSCRGERNCPCCRGPMMMIPTPLHEKDTTTTSTSTRRSEPQQ